MVQENIMLDIAPQNSWTVGRKETFPGVNFVNRQIEDIMEKFPVGDVWPFEQTTLYELKRGRAIVPFYHADFKSNYRNVGPFPGIGLSIRQINLRLLKALVGVAEPII